MLKRFLGPLLLATLIATSAATAQATPVKIKEPISNGRTLSEWIMDLKGRAPQTRNAAAYEIAGMGPAAVRAVPALIEALDDPSRWSASRSPSRSSRSDPGPRPRCPACSR